MSNKVLVETSARHVHLAREHVEVLFGIFVENFHYKLLHKNIFNFFQQKIL
jgi:propanediol utilization protein